MRRKWLLAGALSFGLTLSAGITYAVVTAPVGRLVCSVTQAGADPTGVTNASTSFADAVTCATNNRLTTVHVPRGKYRLNSPLSIPAGVALVGDSPGGYSADSDSALPVLSFPDNVGNAITVGQGSVIAGVHIRFRTPAGNATSPSVKQLAGGNAINITAHGGQITNVRIEQPNVGIFAAATANAGRFEVTQVHITSPRSTGVFLGATWDVTRVTDVHVWDNFGNGVPGSPVPGTRGFVFEKNDYLILDNLSVFGIDWGFEFRANSIGETIGTASNLTADATARGVVMTAGQMSFSGGVYVNHHYCFDVSGNARAAVAGATMSSNGAPCINAFGSASIDVTGSRITANGTASGVNASTTGNVTVGSNQITGHLPIAITGGNFATITGNTVTSTGNHAMLFNVPPAAATVTGNVIDVRSNPFARPWWGDWGAGTVFRGNSVLCAAGVDCSGWAS